MSFIIPPVPSAYASAFHCAFIVRHSLRIEFSFAAFVFLSERALVDFSVAKYHVVFAGEVSVGADGAGVAPDDFVAEALVAEEFVQFHFEVVGGVPIAVPIEASRHFEQAAAFETGGRSSKPNSPASPPSKHRKNCASRGLPPK